VYFETDFSRFDSSIHPELLLFECDVYARLGMNKNVLKVMRKNLSSRLYTSQGVMLDVEGTRRSGTPNTSCGNSLLNGLIHACVMHKAGVHNYKMIMLGDDNLTLINPAGSSDARPTFTEQIELFAKFGLKAVTKISYGGEEYAVEFCSSKFWPIYDNLGKTHILGPKIGRTLAKFGWFINPPVQKAQRDLILSGTVTSRWQDFRYLPVLRVMAERLSALSTQNPLDPNTKAMPAVKDYKAHARHSHAVNDDIYHDIQLHSGVTKTMLDELERLFSSVTMLPAVVKHPALELLVEADL